MTDTTADTPATARMDRWIGAAAALATVSIWAFWIVGTRHAVATHFDVWGIGLLRYGLPALILAPVWLRMPLLPRELGPLTAVGLLGAGAPFFLAVATGMTFAPASDAGPLLPGTMPLFVAALSALVLHQRIGPVRAVGLALMVAGVAAIGGHAVFESTSGAWRGHLLFLSGALMWAIYTLAFRRSGLTALQGAALVSLWSTILLLPLGLPSLIGAVRAGLIGDLLVQTVVQGLLSGVISVILYGVAVRRLGAAPASAFAALVPGMAAGLAVPMLGEALSWATLAGIAASTAGVMLASGALGGAGPRR